MLRAVPFALALTLALPAPAGAEEEVPKELAKHLDGVLKALEKKNEKKTEDWGLTAEGRKAALDCLWDVAGDGATWVNKGVELRDGRATAKVDVEGASSKIEPRWLMLVVGTPEGERKERWGIEGCTTAKRFASTFLRGEAPPRIGEADVVRGGNIELLTAALGELDPSGRPADGPWVIGELGPEGEQQTHRVTTSTAADLAAELASHAERTPAGSLTYPMFQRAVACLAVAEGKERCLVFEERVALGNIEWRYRSAFDSAGGLPDPARVAD